MQEFISENAYVMDIIWTLALMIFSWIGWSLINRAIVRHVQDPHRAFMAKRLNYYFVIIFFIVGFLSIWLQFARSLSTFLGLFTAGLAVALREVFSNIAAWIIILATKPFSIGDRMSINGQRGDVIDMRLFHFSLVEISDPAEGEQSTGKMIDIPNHYIFSHPVINYTKGFPYIWDEIEVDLTLDSDWQLAKARLEEILIQRTQKTVDTAKETFERTQQNNALFYTVLSPTVYLDVKNDCIVFKLRYLCEPKMKRHLRQEIWQEILSFLKTQEKIYFKA